MKTRPIVPAHIDWSYAAAPFAPTFGDVYHSRAGALAQAREVFLRGNGLPERWRGRSRFVVLETGFGLGNNFLALWDAWRSDPMRCDRLHVVAIDLRPPAREDLLRAHGASPLPGLAGQLVRSWPPLTHDMHRLAFENGRVELLLAFGDVSDWLREIVAAVDAFFLDGFAPDRNPAMWEPRMLKRLGRLAARGSTAATWSAARAVRDALAAGGFRVERAPGFGGKRDMTVARFEPRFEPPRPPAFATAYREPVEVAIVGAGIAGCAAASVLAQAGHSVTVFEAEPRAATGGSSQPAGLFHGIVHPDDGPHARFTRAAAFAIERELSERIDDAALQISIGGLLRLEHRRRDLASMRALLAAQGLPAEYVEALDASAATALAGVSIGLPAWLYPGGGSVHPGELCSAWLRECGAEWRGATRVRRVLEAQEAWNLVDDDGAVIARAPVVVIAAGPSSRVLVAPRELPLRAVRGQTTRIASVATTLRMPRLPIADAGYVVPLRDGSALAGATSDLDDEDAEPRRADDLENLARFERLTGNRRVINETTLEGRAGVRLVAADRLPLIGPLPAATPCRREVPMHRARHVPREPGLYVITALGSRGITWSMLGARVLAAWIGGAPLPLPASLIEAVDAGRFDARRSGAG